MFAPFFSILNDKNSPGLTSIYLESSPIFVYRFGITFRVTNELGELPEKKKKQRQ